MTEDALQTLIEDATFDYTMGEHNAAKTKISEATSAAPDSFAAWHASAEIHLNLGDLDAALAAAERGHALRPDDLFINTTLSRIWVGKGDKDAAEKFGAQAKMLGWKEQLKSPPDQSDGL
ncbi:MAG: tetratricopeptide repeat protein [Candidatus Synoicihabitans palmerolidicus]|nr:tetratricopeptide repeat protein [Candidatus Synoicihabitans palmerolidicus]